MEDPSARSEQRFLDGLLGVEAHRSQVNVRCRLQYLESFEVPSGNPQQTLGFLKVWWHTAFVLPCAPSKAACRAPDCAAHTPLPGKPAHPLLCRWSR